MRVWRNRVASVIAFIAIVAFVSIQSLSTLNKNIVVRFKKPSISINPPPSKRKKNNGKWNHRNRGVLFIANKIPLYNNITIIKI